MLNKLLTKLQQKYSDSSLFKEGGVLAPVEEKEKLRKVTLPLFRLMFSPFNQILNHGKVFFALSLSAALLITLSATLLGFNYLCAYSSGSAEGLFCSNSLLGYFAYSIIKMLILAYVGIKWYEYVFISQPMSKKSIFAVDGRYLKFAGSLLLVLLLNLLPILSWWILYMRNPNPDWRVEMVFFAVVSLGFIVPIVLLRFYSALVFVMRGEKIPSLSYLWHQTSGNSLKIFLSFMLILVVAMFVFGNLYTNFRALSLNVSLYNMLLSEYIYDFFALFIYISILNNLNIQYEILYAQAEEDAHAGN